MNYAIRWLGLACLLSLIGAGLAMTLTGGDASTALAASTSTGPLGRPWNYSYFTDKSTPEDDLTWVFIPMGNVQYDGLGQGCGTNDCTMNESNFIQVYHDRLYDTASETDEGRAAAEIDIMLGEPGATFDNSIANGIAYAQAHFAQWEDLIETYASGSVPGYSVNWDVDDLYYTSDAMGTDDQQNGASCEGYSGYACLGDVEFIQTENDTNVDKGVVFTANGQQLIIKYKCANMEGSLNSLPNPSSSITITKTSSHPSAMPIGTTMDYDLNVAEQEDVGLNRVTINDTIPSEYTYVGPDNGSPAPTTINGNTLTWDFNALSNANILQNIADGNETLTFQVKAVSSGTAVNTATGTATNVYGASEPVNPGSVTNVVQALTTPVVQGLNGDVHAGGGPCGGQLSSGFVAGYSNAGSYASYAVSATGSVSNFSSNAGINNLTVGQNGGYNEICEPDLYNVAMNNYGKVQATVLTANTSRNPYDIAGWSGIYYVWGNAYITASAPISNRMTIISIGGTIYITRNIELTATPAAPDNVPSVGLISGQNIEIDAPVLRVDAYMFSEGDIDTCEAGTGSCLSTLTVNGFLMGQDIYFDRLGPANSYGSPVAEQVVLNPQIYLNPPTFFDNDSVNNVALSGQGEKQPLY